MKLLVMGLFISIILSGCSQDSNIDTYPSAVVFDNILFGLSRTEVPSKDIGQEIGKVQKIKTPIPESNGESNDVPVGSAIFEIEGVDPKDSIAIKIDEVYYRATHLFLVEERK